MSETFEYSTADFGNNEISYGEDGKCDVKQDNVTMLQNVFIEMKESK